MIILLVIIFTGSMSVWLYRERQQAKERAYYEELSEKAHDTLNEYLDGLGEDVQGTYSRLCADSFNAELLGETVREPGKRYSYSVRLTGLDLEQMLGSMEAEIQSELVQKVAAASRLSEIYDDSLNYLPDIINPAVDTVLSERLKRLEDFEVLKDFDFNVVIAEDGSSRVDVPDGLDEFLRFTVPGTAEEYSESLISDAKAGVEFIPIHYSIPDGSERGYTPDPDGYGETDDPAVIQALLDSPYAQQLIGNRKPVWNPQLNFIPGTDFKYYFDESILVLLWYEATADACGTYMEIFASDGSQIRRQLASQDATDVVYSLGTLLSIQADAVSAVSGDLYNHWHRKIGICVNNGEITRFSPRMCDMCWVTSNGDFLLTYENEITDYDAALDFIESNDIEFSLCFGPLLVKDGRNVANDAYPWGEVTEDYPRCGIAQVDSLHYLALTVTCDRTHGYTDWGCNIYELGSAFASHNVSNAYALDGGQTGEMIYDDRIVCPFGYDKEQNVSDIIYFASAVNN